MITIILMEELKKEFIEIDELKIIKLAGFFSVPDDAKEFEKLKLELSKKYQYDREKYTDAKSVFIKKIMQKMNINMLCYELCLF